MLLPDAPVSIDIGSSAVKVAQLRGGRSGVRAIRFGEQPLPEGFHWQLGADISPLVETIRRAMRNAGIRSRRAIIAVPRRHVTARISAFPPSDRTQMARVVKYDLADHIPFPVEQVVADFQPLGPSLEQPGMTDVLVVAAQRDLVMQYLELARALGMRLSALTVDSFALHDLATLREEGDPGICLSLELGKRASLIGVSQGKRLRLTRSVPFGSYQLALALRDDLGLTLEAAEQRVQSEGLEVLAGTPRPTRVAAWLDNLRGEMQRSALSFGQAGISHIYLAGAAARTPGLAKAIETEFSVAPTLLSPASLFPTAQLQGSGELVAERCLLAIGQGLRGLGRSAFTISLVPEEVGTERRGALTRRLVAVASVALLGLLAWSYVGAKNYVAEEQTQVATLTKLEARAKGDADDAARVMQTRDALRTELEALAPVRARRYTALELLKAVSAGSSGEVILSHFAMRPEQPLVLRGTAPDSAAAADLQAKLSEFRLVNRASLDRVDLIEPGQTGPGARGYRPPAAAAATAKPGSSDRVDFIMTVHLWTEKQARVRRVFSSGAGGAR